MVVFIVGWSFFQGGLKARFFLYLHNNTRIRNRFHSFDVLVDVSFIIPVFIRI